VDDVLFDQDPGGHRPRKCRPEFSSSVLEGAGLPREVDV
jgi:hypothetical protein